VDYAERLTVPLRWWVQGTMLVASLWLALVVALPEAVAWGITAAVLALLAGAFLAYGSARVAVAGGVLNAGRARIPVDQLGPAVPLDAEAMRRLAGRDADARAYLLLRPYLKRGVRVDVTDPADPTPYWLLSSRRPDRLVAAIRQQAPASTND
jgi:hypothetical protein